MAFNFNGNTPKKILYNGLNVAKLVYNGVVVWMSKVLATISGILPLTLTDCTGDDLVDYKIYGNQDPEAIILPDEYVRLDYIESTGAQYIDTGYRNNTPKTGYYIKYQNSKNHSGDDVVMGVLSPNRASGIKNLQAITYWKQSGTGSDGSTSVPILQSDIVETWLNFKNNNKRQININGEMSIIEDVSNVTTTNNSPCLIFGASFGNNVYGRSNGLRVFSVKISENNELVREFIPCKNSNNEVGLYDLVENTFYTNAGTGTFNTGSVVSKKSVGDLVTDTSDTNYGKYKIPILTNSHTTNIYLNKPLRRTSKLPYGYTELEHIRSTGTQYIDTGRKMYNNSEIELCFSFDVMQQNCSIFGSRTSSTKNNFEVASQNPNFPIYLDFGNFNTSRATYNNAVINTKYICTISKSLRAVYDENRTLLVRNTTLISADNVTPSNARIFDTVGGYSQSKLKGKVYYCKIWENGVLVRNMIPCKNSSNVVGLYDTVNDVFYTNAGSGSFIAGAEVETVYYTDYLDYENQKVVRNVDDNDKGIDTPVEESIVLPAVPTDEGTTVFDVDTEIAPSYAEIKYYKNGS